MKKGNIEVGSFDINDVQLRIGAIQPHTNSTFKQGGVVKYVITESFANPEGAFVPMRCLIFVQCRMLSFLSLLMRGLATIKILSITLEDNKV